MEPERNETDHAAERTKAQRAGPGVKQPAFTPSFASEGLESLRDSNC
jgi:hypothetical protein